MRRHSQPEAGWTGTHDDVAPRMHAGTLAGPGRGVNVDRPTADGALQAAGSGDGRTLPSWATAVPGAATEDEPAVHGAAQGALREDRGVTTSTRSTPPMATRTKVLITVFGVLVLFSMLVTGVFDFLLAPPKKVLVVTMQQGAGQPARQQLKDDCGHLPGVALVEDQGNPDPAVQGRFPVRFDLGGAADPQEAKLEACVSRHPTVRGFLTEGDQ